MSVKKVKSWIRETDFGAIEETVLSSSSRSLVCDYIGSFGLGGFPQGSLRARESDLEFAVRARHRITNRFLSDQHTGCS